MHRFGMARTRMASSMALLCIIAGCAKPAAVAPAPEPVFFLLAVPASVDSTVLLARLALREVNGALQSPGFANGVTSVTSHYVRARRDGGETRVVVVLEVSHKVADPSQAVTGVRLSGWALDYAGDFLSGPRPAPTNRRAPPLSGGTTPSPAALLNTRPRPITEYDDEDMQEMEHVLTALLKFGARRMP